jgi:hypothetical protein
VVADPLFKSATTSAAFISERPAQWHSLHDMGDAPPSLIIRYSSDFSFSIRLSGVQVYEVASPDYRFEFACRIQHPTGEFTYTATNIFLRLKCFVILPSS